MSPDGTNQQRFAGNLGGIDPGAEGVGIGTPVLTPDGTSVLVPLRGATAITLATGGRQHFPFCTESVLWSPDGSTFVCSGRSFTAPIYIATQPGGPKRALPRTQGASPDAWSPDGNWILFSVQAGSGPYYLWRIHPDGTGLQRISPFTPTSDVLWLPDGRAEFAGTRGLDTARFEKLVALDPNTGQVQVLGRLPWPDDSTWSPDGTTLAFTTSDNGQRPSAIYTVGVSGTGLRRLSPRGTEQYDLSPAWSPDGKSLVFVRQTDTGISRYASEIWTMNADGSQQRQLTRPYPDGGENVEPLWVNGPVQVTTAPQAQAAENTLRVPYPLAGVVARGSRVAVAAYGYDNAAGGDPTPPLLVWRPGTRKPESLVGALCGTVTPEFFTGHRLAITCNSDFLDEHRQAVLDFDLRTRVPAEPVFAYNAYFGPTAQYGTVVNGPVLSAGRIEFETSNWVGPSRKHPNSTSKLRRQILWAAHGFGRTKLYSAHLLGPLITGDNRWLVFLAGGGVQIASPNGRPLWRLHLPALQLSYRIPAPSYLITGDELVRLGSGTLEAWDVRSGQVLLDRSVPTTAQLDAVDGPYIVYTTGADLHVISGSADKVIHTPASGAGGNNRYGTPAPHLVYATLGSAGLFYAYDVKSTALPGRVVFVPRSRLPR